MKKAMKNLTYRKAGVDIQKADALKKKIRAIARTSFGPGVIGNIGGFGSFFALAPRRFKDPVLVSSADGVGTKLKIALLAGRHDTVGIDAVAMNVNDILCTGATPLFFLDYIAYSSCSSGVLEEVVRGINKGCLLAGCSLIGGETAQMPGMYAKGEYDLAGFCVGAVERSRIIDGSRIEKGDILVGLESSGLHSNGYSLVRSALSLRELKAQSAQLLIPTRIYVRPVLSLLRAAENDPSGGISGISHITGGAFYDKVSRILPGNTDALIYKASWRVPEIFRFIQSRGAIGEEQMYHTLNMGIGMVLAIKRRFVKEAVLRLKASRLKNWVIGEIVKGKGCTQII